MENNNKRKYFNWDNNNTIYNRLMKETIISYIPYLGQGLQFGAGDIVLEEDGDIYKFYIIDRDVKFCYEEFDNVVSAMEKLVTYYDEAELIDDPDKMMGIFCASLNIKRNNGILRKKRR